jgi:hypothetical protein
VSAYRRSRALSCLGRRATEDHRPQVLSAVECEGCAPGSSLNELFVASLGHCALKISWIVDESNQVVLGEPPGKADLMVVNAFTVLLSAGDDDGAQSTSKRKDDRSDPCMRHDHLRFVKTRLDPLVREVVEAGSTRRPDVRTSGLYNHSVKIRERFDCVQEAVEREVTHSDRNEDHYREKNMFPT